jgi:hypothetical protein
VTPNDNINDGIIKTKLDSINEVCYVRREISVESLSSGTIGGEDILYG